MFNRLALKQGDSIGILSTARWIDESELQNALEIFKSWGLNPVLGETISARFNQFAGEDSVRANDLQQFMDNPEIKAIVCARGGYGTIRIMEALDFTGFMENPKWICGFSDITVLHAHINDKLGIPSLHCTMPFSFANNSAAALSTLNAALFGNPLSISCAHHPLNKQGTAEGVLIGGNLSILYSLLGTKFGFSTGHKILFIEDIDEYLYHIDRMLMSLKLAGKLEFVKGIIVGGMTDMKDNKVKFGISAEEIIANHVSKYDIPVCYGFPSGHIPDNRAMIFGTTVKLSVTNTETTLSYL